MRRTGLAVALLFVVLALPFLGQPGIQDDEALFGNGVFQPYVSIYSAQAFGVELPLMLMTYVGALKAYLYKAIFLVAGPSAASVRLPMILAGAVTVWLFFDLLRRTAGPRAAWIGGLLLATDASFMLTRRYDWGPVALAHLFAVGGVWCIIRFAESGKRMWLAAGFFAFGLGLWDKALFVWILAGLAVATIVAFPTFFRTLLIPRNLVVAAIAFSIGCYPLLRYNFSKKQATLRENVHFVVQDPIGKAAAMKATLDGTILFGWLSHDSGRTPLPSLTTWLLLGCVLISPLVFGRSLLFGLICFSMIWVLMIFTKDTGGSAHHTILVWPLPQFLIASVLAGLSARIGAKIPAALAILAAVANLYVVTQFYSDLTRYGGGRGWSDATYLLPKEPAVRDASTVGVLDWGFEQTLHLLSRGKIVTRYIDREVIADANPAAQRALQELIEDRRAVFLRYTPGNEFLQGATETLDQFAAGQGLKHRALSVIADSVGRPMIEVFRYIPSSSAEVP